MLVLRHDANVHRSAALQEVWTSDSLNEYPQPYSTTIGFHDGKRERWTAVWIYPAQGTPWV